MASPRSPRPARPAKRPLDGVLLIDKPVGVSSHDALQRAKGLFRAQKAGHTGTLDPLASGLLPVCFGEATKFSQDLLDADKGYEATLQLGVCTDTGDAEGRTLRTRVVDVTWEAAEDVLHRFRGTLEQIPPMYSAIKRDGKPLYEYARAGEAVERAPRTITIHSLEHVVATPAMPAASVPMAGAALLAASSQLRLRVRCSKGTYIRTLAEDIGEALGCGAHLVALRRTHVGALTLDQAVAFPTLQAEMDALQARDEPLVLSPAPYLQPVDLLLSSFPAVTLDDDFARRFLHGQRLRLEAATEAATDTTGQAMPEAQGKEGAAWKRVRVYTGSQRLLGTARLEDGLLSPERLVGAVHPV